MTCPVVNWLVWPLRRVARALLLTPQILHSWWCLSQSVDTESWKLVCWHLPDDAISLVENPSLLGAEHMRKAESFFRGMVTHGELADLRVSGCIAGGFRIELSVREVRNTLAGVIAYPDDDSIGRLYFGRQGCCWERTETACNWKKIIMLTGTHRHTPYLPGGLLPLELYGLRDARASYWKSSVRDAVTCQPFLTW